MAAFFRNLKESMIDSCEQMIRVFEEGTSILLGLAQNKTEDDSTFPDESFTDDLPMHDDSLVIGEDEAVDNMKSPLDGITEDVLSDIMSNQVSFMCHWRWYYLFRVFLSRYLQFALLF